MGFPFHFDVHDFLFFQKNKIFTFKLRSLRKLITCTINDLTAEIPYTFARKEIAFL